MNGILVGLVLALFILLLSGVRLVRRWMVGGEARIDWVGGLLGLPRVYLHDVHNVVARERTAGPMHALTAGGLLSTMALLVAMAFGLQGVWAGALLLVTLSIMLGGTVLVVRRRYPVRPARLSGGVFQRLPLILLFFILAVATLALGQFWHPVVATLGAWATGAALVLLTREIGSGPLKHVLAGALHLAAHPRRERFGAARPVADLKPLDLSAQTLGSTRASDFAWNRLLGFDACVQCGRCESVCPAYAAGLPLNPKALIQDFVASMPGGPTFPYRGSSHPPAHESRQDTVSIQLDDDGRAVIDGQTLWACTTCRACVEECPMMIEHVDAVVDLRRHQTLMLGATPGQAPVVLAELNATDNLGGRAAVARVDWAADLRLPLLHENTETDVLLWLGEGAFDQRHQRTLRALVQLLRIAGVNFAVLGKEEIDCGDTARRLGDEALFQSIARRNIALLSTRRFNRIVTADPHVLHSLRNEYPALGGYYEVQHHSAVLARLLAEGRLQPRVPPEEQKITFHDPCYLGRYNGETEAPRAILDAIGMQRIEMERSGRRSTCCGGGGGAPLTDINGPRRMPDLRMTQVRLTGASTVAVACPNCAFMLESVAGPRPVVADLAELLVAAL
ncbi:Fe-S oxidoreductase [Paraburkholderia sp. BL18I3N2]|uniref:DUF3483 domain-containing protein n=1 Tax=unclassified Paraburkholderia TaxID=2615204 RepID=UPI000D05DF9E|nr:MULTISPECIES: DUF3483 domain-containing protein [unclassified Paraburkholderia]PRX18850.1 Fe-S oxidoreductase [Paraburkholderia sp. BL18I3N2]PRX87895.1 Fe-S oxidoreductase [Paraburkholderia sp. BL25I1N1]